MKMYLTGLGMSQVIGHVDFFPNGGVEMPECQSYRNVEITKEEILNDPSKSLAYINRSVTCRVHIMDECW